MNPKQEFIKAIMQVLRLEANIYTMGAIEEIIDRLEVQDYTLFIAYLGERESDYEKPIESIAKGVNEFYELKTSPMIRAAREKANRLVSCLRVYFFEKHDRQEDVSKIVGVVFVVSDEKFIFSKESLDIVMSCEEGFNKFKESGFNWCSDLEDAIFKKLTSGKIKPNIEERIENKSIAMAKNTLGICVQALGLNKEKEMLY
ncbi:MAG: hypothetical protein EOL95_10850 [Bacteroidia bacterium]|nr:hypothetical protein [Bacteroidia bacterium]